MKVCEICGQPLKTGNKKREYGTKEGMDHLSRHHFFPKRFGKYFTKSEVLKIFGISKTSDMGDFCYECHEEVLHNIVLNRSMVVNLSKILKGKDKKEKIVLLHRMLKRGISLSIMKSL